MSANSLGPVACTNPGGQITQIPPAQHIAGNAGQNGRPRAKRMLLMSDLARGREGSRQTGQSASQPQPIPKNGSGLRKQRHIFLTCPKKVLEMEQNTTLQIVSCSVLFFLSWCCEAPHCGAMRAISQTPFQPMAGGTYQAAMYAPTCSLPAGEKGWLI